MPENKITILKKALFLFFPFLLMGLTYSLLGCFHETNDDPAFDGLMQGIFSEKPVNKFYIFHFITSRIVSGLYQVNGEIPWYPALFFAFLGLALYNIFRLLHREFSGEWKLFLAFLLIFIALFSDDLVFFSFTRISCLLAGSSLMRILILLHRDPSKRLDRESLLIQIFLLLLAFLSRPESLIMAFALCLPMISFFDAYSKNLRFRNTFLLLIGGLILYLSPGFFMGKEGKAFRKKHAYVSTFLNSSLEQDNWVSEPSDTVMRKAAMNWFIADPDIYDIDAWQRMTFSSPYHLKTLRKSQENRVSLWESLKKKYLNFLLIEGLIIIASILFILLGWKRNFGLKLLLYQIWFFLFLFAVASFIKMPDRTLSPATGLIIILNLGLGLQLFKDGNGRNTALLVSSFVLLLLSTSSLKYLSLQIPQFKAWKAENKRIYQTCQKNFSGSRIAYLLPSMSLLTDNNPFCPPYSGMKLRHSILIGWPVTLPFFAEELEQYAPLGDFKDHFEAFAMDKTIFISSDGYNRLISEYFKTFYGSEPNWLKDPVSQKDLEKRGLAYFYIKGFKKPD